MTPEIACRFGCAFGQMLGAGKTVVMGRDTRPSGSMIAASVSAGLMAAGVDVIELGVVTTPGTALMVRRCQADGGVMITASHNPSPYNGIKFLQSTGPGLRAEDAAKLKDIWQGGDYALVDGPEVGQRTENRETHQAHVEAVCKIVDVDLIASKGFRVVLDSINGAGCEVTPMLLSRLGCQLTHVNAEPTGRFAHTPEPVAENLAELCERVRQAEVDVAFAQDPDADRLVVIDEDGNFIGEEYTLALAAAAVLRKQKGKIAVNMVTSRMIDDLAEAADCEVVRSPTGEANVVQVMETEGAFFGGEGNGGVIEPRVVPVRDSLAGMALILQYLAETGQKISQLVAEIPCYVMRKTKLSCPLGAAEKVAAATRERFAGRDGASFNEDDGLRVALPDGWVSVRASNTEPIMRIFAEARTADFADALVAEVSGLAEDVLAGES